MILDWATTLIVQNVAGLFRAVQGFQGTIDRNQSAPESAIGIRSPL
jgi:hypothetical protein